MDYEISQELRTGKENLLSWPKAQKVSGVRPFDFGFRNADFGFKNKKAEGRGLRDSGIQGFRNSGIRKLRNLGIEELRN